MTILVAVALAVMGVTVLCGGLDMGERFERIIHGVCLLLFAVWLATHLVGCQPPATVTTHVLEGPPAECPTVDLVEVGDRLQVGLAVDGVLALVEFNASGELVEVSPAELLEGGAPRLELREGRWCAVGSWEGDPCFEEVWRQGRCW